MKNNLQRFGGAWTQKKLQLFEKYLIAYSTIMNKKQQFQYAYIDAFAGTGYFRKDRILNNPTLKLEFGNQEKKSSKDLPELLLE